MKTFGYCRISTEKQSINRQIENIKEFNPDVIIKEEVFTGTSLDRPVWNRLMKTVKPGDTIIFDEVSRMSRDAEEGFRAYQNLMSKGVNLVFLKERHIDTSVYKGSLQKQIDIEVNTGKESTDTFFTTMIEGMNKLLMDIAKEQIEIAFRQAQEEVNHLHQRTHEGVQRAIERYQDEEKQGRPHLKNMPGWQKGKPRPKIVTKKSQEMKEKIRKMSKTFGGNMTDKEVIETLKIARNTYFKYKAQLREEMEK